MTTLVEALFDKTIPDDQRMYLMNKAIEYELKPGAFIDGFLLAYIPKKVIPPRKEEMGFFGNVWVRKLSFDMEGSTHDGHKHHHDHVSFVTSGQVEVEVEGYKPQVFTAPTFFVVKAELCHKITALVDNTTQWCVFALRDENGELTDHYTGDNSPYSQKVDK